MAFPARVSNAAIAQINVTPLVDVLLVLLIIFMITAPVITHNVRIDLPQGHSTASSPAQPAHLIIRADGSMSWNDVALGPDALRGQLALLGRSNGHPSLLIAAADAAPYQAVAGVLADARRSGITDIGFDGSR